MENDNVMEAGRGISNGHEWVDLGLPSGTKWATCNVGASSPEEYGDYFAWGETTTKCCYEPNAYKWTRAEYKMDVDVDIELDAKKLTKYNTETDAADDKWELDAEDDAAHVVWGGEWRMPTNEEWTELRKKCVWTWTTHYGKNGYRVQSKVNGNSIFLPAAGEFCFMDIIEADQSGEYWSKSLDVDVPTVAHGVIFAPDEYCHFAFDRYRGYSIRPVIK